MKITAKKDVGKKEPISLGSITSTKLTKQQLRQKLYQRFPQLDFFRVS